MTINPGLLRMLGVDGFETATYTERVYVPRNVSIICPRNRPIQSVNSINDVEDLAYFTKEKSIHLLKPLCNTQQYVKVVYVAGYDVIPADLMRLSDLYTKLEQDGVDFGSISRYKLGDEDVLRGGVDKSGLQQFSSMFHQYRLARVVG